MILSHHISVITCNVLMRYIRCALPLSSCNISRMLRVTCNPLPTACQIIWRMSHITDRDDIVQVTHHLSSLPITNSASASRSDTSFPSRFRHHSSHLYKVSTLSVCYVTFRATWLSYVSCYPSPITCRILHTSYAGRRSWRSVWPGGCRAGSWPGVLLKSIPSLSVRASSTGCVACLFCETLKSWLVWGVLFTRARAVSSYGH